MAFLAAVPAATVANDGALSLIALDQAATISPEIQDYPRRYRPEAVYVRGDGGAPRLALAGRTSSALPAASADETASINATEALDYRISYE